MGTFTCINCFCELDTFHESLEVSNMCDDCVHQASEVEEGENRWCNQCQMFSHFTDNNPYGTCGCS